MAEELNDNLNAAVAANPPPQAESKQKSSASESRPQTAQGEMAGGLSLLIVGRLYYFGNRPVTVYDILGDGTPADGHDSIKVKARSLVQISGSGLGIYDKVILRVDTKGYRPVHLKRSDRQISFKVPNFDSVYPDGQRIYIELYSSEIPSAAVRTNQYLTYTETSEEERKKQGVGEGGEKEGGGQRGVAGGFSPVQLVVGATKETLGGVAGGLAAGFLGQALEEEKDFEPQEVVSTTLSEREQVAAEDTEDMAAVQTEQKTVVSGGGATGISGSTGVGVSLGQSGTVQGRESVRSEAVAGGTAAFGQTVSQSGTVIAEQAVSDGGTVNAQQTVSQGGTVSGQQVISQSGTVSGAQGFQAVSEGSTAIRRGLGVRAQGAVSKQVTAQGLAAVAAGATAAQGAVSGEIKTAFAPISGEQRQSLIDQTLATVDGYFDRFTNVQVEAHPKLTQERVREIWKDRAIGDVGIVGQEAVARLAAALQQIDGQSWNLKPQEVDWAIRKMTWAQLRRALIDAELSGAKIGDVIRYVLKTDPLPQGKVETEGPQEGVILQPAAEAVPQGEEGAVSPKEEEYEEKLEVLRRHDRAFKVGAPIDSLGTTGPSAPVAAQVSSTGAPQAPKKPAGAQAEKPIKTLPVGRPATEPLAGKQFEALPKTEPPLTSQRPLEGAMQKGAHSPPQGQPLEAGGGALGPSAGLIPRAQRGKEGPSSGSTAEAAKAALETKAAKLASPALERAAFWVWGMAIPSFGLSILIGAIIGDVIWIFKGTLLSFRLKLHVMAMNVVIVFLALLVVLLLAVTVKYFCDNWLTYGVIYLSGYKEICDALR